MPIAECMQEPQNKTKPFGFCKTMEGAKVSFMKTMILSKLS